MRMSDFAGVSLKVHSAWGKPTNICSKYVEVNLCSGVMLSKMPQYWRDMPYIERAKVMALFLLQGRMSMKQVEDLHLRTVGDSKTFFAELMRHIMIVPTAKFGPPDASSECQPFDYGTPVPYTPPRKMREPRILNSVYSKLTKQWRRSSGQFIDVHYMTASHARGAVRRLNESHGGLQDKCAAILGRMHAHFENSAEITHLIEGLYGAIMATDVSEVYPIFDKVALQSKIGDEPVDEHVELNPSDLSNSTDWQ